MATVTDLRLRNWLAPILKGYGQWLERTPDGAQDYKHLGRWSRWDKHGLLETHVNLEDLASRVRSKLNEPREATRPHIAFPVSSGTTGIPGSR